MTRLLLLLGIVFLQIAPEITGNVRGPVERPRTMEESNVDSLMPTTGTQVPVRVETLENVPVAVPERDAFLKGFRGAFLERELATERVAKQTGAVKPGSRLRNPLRLAEGDDEKGAWRVRVRLDWFTPSDSGSVGVDSLARAWPGRGARVTIVVGWPEGPRVLPPEQTRTEWLRFPAGHPVDRAYYQQAGRQVAFLTLEVVERATGDLGEDQRLRLEDTRRVPPVVAR
jgi:hypothetical protein